MTGTTDFTRQFLLAMPGTTGDEFAGTVIYVCEHSSQGALGLVLNRPMKLTVGELLEKIDIPVENQDLGRTPVYFGGPVQADRGFVLHRPVMSYNSSLHLDGDIGLTTSRDVLENLGKGTGPSDLLVALGYAGWGAGQLEQEMAQNVWLSVPADEEIIFNLPPEERYPTAMRLLGFDPAMLTGEVGHA
ncbi:YqgE/AlgH family protein [Orrella sp. 11846]|uniref:YqgE/AlgH family protein n=1 Tax=Orrella sp. 11846 TaxID=3409913 RepID=UPI003B58E0F2